MIIVSSDHDMPFPRAKGSADLDSNHVPLAIRWPAGIRKAGRSIDDFVNFTDIAPTILDLAGIDPKRSGMQPITGKSLRPILDSDRSGRVVPERDHTLVGKERTDVGRPNDEGYPIRGIVTDTHLFLKNYEATRWPAGNPETGYLDTDGSPTKTLILERGRQDRQDRFWQLNFGMRPQRELYDLVRDRDCSRNQADSMAQASVLAELEKRMEKELLDQGDPRMKGEGQIFDRYLPTNGAGFYEKFQRGEKVNAGWVSPTDFEKSPLPKPTGASKSNSKPRPNIIVVMCDDVGYSDIGCFGGEIRTPTLDGLAAGGLRFTQFYNTARCCPTRATLLTGLYAHQAGIGHMVDDFSTKVGESYAGDLSKKAVTIAEVLKPAGYSTYMAGKWHVTKVTRPANDSDKHNWPLQRGFDRFYGTIHGAGSFYDPNTLVRDNAFVSPFDDPEYRPELFYYTDAINDHAARFVNEHHARQPDKPFFLYMAHTAAHWPMHAKEIDIARYRGRYDGGYDPIRAARIEKMKQLGLIDVRWQIAPQVGQWSEVKNKVWEARCMEVYAAMLDCMDQGLARLVDALKRNGQFENTLILYLQDNGGCAEGMGRGGAFTARSDKPTMAPLPNSYLQPDMIPKQTRDGFPVRQGEGVLPGPADTYIGYGRAWANVSNTPFREYKHWQHEGGISSPLIAHWPDGISGSLAGQLQSQPAHLIDLMATCVDLADAEYPTRMHDQTIQPMEGVSLQPAFSGDRIRRNNPIFWEHEGNRAVRQGDWKLVSKHPGPWELYNLADDRAEMNAISQREPSRVAELSSLWDEWSKRVGVAPWPLKATAEPKRN